MDPPAWQLTSLKHRQSLPNMSIDDEIHRSWRSNFNSINTRSHSYWIDNSTHVGGQIMFSALCIWTTHSMLRESLQKENLYITRWSVQNWSLDPFNKPLACQPASQSVSYLASAVLKNFQIGDARLLVRLNGCSLHSFFLSLHLLLSVFYVMTQGVQGV